METSNMSPGGLWAVNYKDTMAQMKSLGFNTIRLPFSEQALASSNTPSGINFTLNPDLQGLDAMGVLDAIVAQAKVLGLKIILDHHTSSIGSGGN
jgi:aryl-phospho-beta-D-glucosidase BglC (GH1 family)